MRVKYVPNEFAKRLFNLAASEYEGEGLTPLLQGVLGSKKYNEYMVAQDPFCGGIKENDIDIILNRGETNPNRMEFRSIGKVYDLS